MLFKEKFKSNSKIFLDGGNGSEIAKLGGEMSPAFSALASIISPEIVIKVHESKLGIINVSVSESVFIYPVIN